MNDPAVTFQSTAQILIVHCTVLDNPLCSLVQNIMETNIGLVVEALITCVGLCEVCFSVNAPDRVVGCNKHMQ